MKFEFFAVNAPGKKIVLDFVGMSFDQFSTLTRVKFDLIDLS